MIGVDKILKDNVFALLDLVKREGIEDLKKFLETSDFFIAPASTKHHNSRFGGLVTHSLNVYNALNEMNDRLKIGLSQETVIVCGLLHDLCKVNYYAGSSINDQFPVGHGEKSVIVAQRFIDLTNEEAAMIRWHMNSWEPGIHYDYPSGYSFRAADAKWKGVAALYIADYTVTRLVEGG